MSQKNVEAVRAVYDAWSRGVPTDAAEALDPDVVWEAIEEAPDAGTYRGHDGVRGYMQDWLDGFELAGMEFRDIVEADDGRLVLVQRGRAKERRTGLETELNYAVVYAFRDGKLMAVKEYATPAEAFEAVGLSE